MEDTTSTRRRRRKADEAPTASPPPPPAAPTAQQRIDLGALSVDVDLCDGYALPRELAFALAHGAPVLRIIDVQKAAAPPSMEVGMQTPTLREYFLGASDLGVAGILTLRAKDGEGWVAGLSKSFLPYVLSAAAVKGGELPPLGQSALPKSLERVVPADYHYWKAATPEDARTVRDALVELGMFDERLMKLVDGEIRLCVEQLYLYEPEATAEKRRPAAALEQVLPEGRRVFSPFAEGAVYDESLLKAVTNADDVVLVLSPPTSPVQPYVEALIKAAPRAAWLFETDANAPADRAQLAKLGPLFEVPGVAGRVFAASFDPGPRVRWCAPPAEANAARAEQTALNVAVTKFAHIEKAGDEQRYVLGIVLEPEVEDAQKDIYSAAEIAQSAHVFMEKFRTVGLMHKGAINDKVKILESYLAPVDFEVDGVPVKKGTWLMAVRVLDDALWSSVKEGGLTGFSIGGSAIRKPDTAAATAN